MKLPSTAENKMINVLSLSKSEGYTPTGGILASQIMPPSLNCTMWWFVVLVRSWLKFIDDCEMLDQRQDMSLSYMSLVKNLQSGSKAGTPLTMELLEL
jgi:hypothetical protein